MLITTNTILPQRHGNGSPVANGRLYARANKNPDSAKLELYRDAELKESAPNPITLNSAGDLPYPVYAKENSAWCHLYAIADGIEDYIRNYPLREMPGDRRFETLERFTNLNIRIKTKAERITANETWGINAIEIETDESDIEQAYFEQTEWLYELGVLHWPYKITTNTVISPAYIGTDDPDNNPNNPEDWWKTFKIGSYGVVFIEGECEDVDVLKGDKYLNSIIGIGALYSDESCMHLPRFGKPPARVFCRVCGRLNHYKSERIDSYNRIFNAFYLVCRVA